MSVTQIALDKFLVNPSVANKHALVLMIDAYDCASNHFVPCTGCKFCEDEELRSIPAALKASGM